MAKFVDDKYKHLVSDYDTPVRTDTINNKMLRFYKCIECGNEYSLDPQQFYQRVKRKNKNRCFTCSRKHGLTEIVKMNKSVPEEERNRINKILSDKAKLRMSELPKSELSSRGEKAWNTRQKNIDKCRDRDIEESKKKARIEYDKQREPILARLKDSSINYWENVSDEEKEKIYSDPERSKKISDSKYKYWKSVDEETKSEIMQKCLDHGITYRNSLTDQEREDIVERLQEGRRLWYDNLTEKEKQDMYKRVSEGRINYWKNLSESERDDIIKKSSIAGKMRWESYTDDEKNEIIKQFQNNANAFRENMTDEQRATINQNISEGRKRYWDNLSDDELKVISNKYRELWHSRPIEVQKMIIQTIARKSNGDNNLRKRFESAFNNSYISNDYYSIPEIATEKNGYIKSWDYGIYGKTSKQLIMVVDLDGAYFHGDNTDYNGITSQESLDERRFLLIPDGVLVCIIYELKFYKSFENMIKQLMLNYDEFIQHQFELCRLMPFPYPKYTSKELIKSFNQLHAMAVDINDIKRKGRYIKENQVGLRLISQFHHSIYSARRAGNISPYDAWYNDDMLKKVIKNRVIYVNTLNPNKILQGFNISKIAPKVSVFSAGRAKLLIYRYLNEYDIVFDPFSGFSGRMLGAVSLGKKYIGQDISVIHVRESNEIIDFLSLQEKATVIQQNVLQSTGTYDCLFTCPPYTDKEQWLDVTVTNNSCDYWITECLKRFKCKKYVFVVDTTDKYKDNIVDELPIRSYFNNSYEQVVVINHVI